MEKEKYTIEGIITIVYMLVAMTGLMFGYMDATAVIVSGLLCYICLFAGRKEYITIGLPDLLLFGYVLLACVSCCWAIAPYAAFEAMRLTLIFTVVYYVTRLYLVRFNLQDKFVAVVNILGLLVSIISIVTFYFLWHDIKGLAFNDYYHFRHMWKPLGYINNAWCEVTLVLLGFAMLSRRFKPILIYMVALAGLISFCRGYYIAFVVLMCVRFIMRHNRETVRNEVVPMVLAMLTVLLIFYGDINAMIERPVVDTWRSNGIEIIGSRYEGNFVDALFGLGGGAYSMYADSSGQFTNVSPNFIAEIIINYGWVGCVLLIMFLLSLAVVVLRRWRVNSIYVFGSVIAAVLVKEMTQGTFGVTPVCYFLMAVVVAVVLDAGGTRRFKVTDKIVGMFVMVPIILAVALRIALPVESIGRFGFNNRYNDSTSRKLVEFSQRNVYDSYPALLAAAMEYDAGNYGRASEIAMEYCNGGIADFIIAQAFRHGISVCDTCNDSFVRSIYSTPALLRTFNATPSDSQLIVNNIPVSQSPVDNAKAGYVLHLLGACNIGDSCLHIAVGRQPSLIAPWRLLGDTIRYNALSGRDMSCLENVDSCARLTEIVLEDYRPRAYVWYGVDLLDR